MRALFDYPKASAFGRMLPKSKIYEYAKASTKLKNLFVTQVDKITWKYKLAPETINLPSTKSVPEIQIFVIALKTRMISEDILRTIDKAIPFPIIFELIFAGKQKVMATYKRPSEGDSHKWVIGDTYFASEWLSIDAVRKPLPVAINMTNLYEKIIREILPLPARDGEELTGQINRAELVVINEKEHKKLEAQIAKEKQFNRKVEMNAKLRNLESAIKELSH